MRSAKFCTETRKRVVSTRTLDGCIAVIVGDLVIVADQGDMRFCEAILRQLPPPANCDK